MTKKQIITDGCEFQSDCIEYKDISYLKIMPICAIHELSIACRDKVNKCKYYTLYKQLKRKEQEFEELKEDRERWKSNFNGKVSAIEELLQQLDQFKVKNIKVSKTLTEIKEIAECCQTPANCKDYCQFYNECIDGGLLLILQKISEVENE